MNFWASWCGWIVFAAGLNDEALDAADPACPVADAVDRAYPDARFLRGMALLRSRHDEPAALAELRVYPRLAPNGPERQQVQGLVDQLTDTAPSTSTP